MSTQDDRKGNEYPQNELPILYKATDVARTLGIAVKTVNKLAREGKLGYVQITVKERRFTADQIYDYISCKSSSAGVDTKRRRSVSSTTRKGGEKSLGSSRRSLVEEMRQWQ
jgi:hypothetical protein